MTSLAASLSNNGYQGTITFLKNILDSNRSAGALQALAWFRQLNATVLVPDWYVDEMKGMQDIG